MAKAIFGHYMGSFAPGFGAIQYHALNGLVTLDAPASVQADRSNLAAWAATTYGGTYRNFALAPQSRTLGIMEAAELEIKRAIRIGMDGFTFDAWAGGKNARDLLDAMFTICEDQDLPFQLGITLDTASMNHTDADIAVYPGNVWEKTINWLLDHHGSSPKLAKRDGKVMIMGYQSIWPGQYAISQFVDTTYPSWTAAQKNTEKNRLRTSEEGWQMIVDAYAAMEVTVGVPIYWEFCLNAFFQNTTGAPSLATAATFLAQHFPALGLFEWVTGTPAIAAAVIAEGAEWSHPMKLQYENYGYYQSASPGLNWIRGDWNYADTLPSTLIQHITWNDYHETTNLSPGYNTRYAYYALTKHFIEAWKADAYAPDVATSDHDEIYIFSHKYAHNTPMFPFQAVTRADNVIEVLSILPTSAKIRVQGRTTTLSESEWTAAAGMDTRQLPLTAGPVVVEWSRDNFVSDINTLTLPEPVSDKPFRQDTGKVAISTECAGQWAIDFPSDGAMLDYSEYADADGDGLPNWFEMLWFGVFGKISTQTSSIASSDPWGTGKTLLQHYEDQTDPYGSGAGVPPDPPLPDPDPDPEPDPPPPTPDGEEEQYYVLGTFNSLFEALTDFEGHALIVTSFQIPETDTEEDILDRDTVCGINDEVPIFFPPQITAKAWLTAETTALLRVQCGAPLDCPELDRVLIRSHGCNPPPNCIAEPDALVAVNARPVCAVPTFFPPRGTFVPPDPPVPPDFPEEEVCTLVHLTYSGSGTWCGFPAFQNFSDEPTKRYLTKTIRGEVQYYNNWPWGSPYDFPTLFRSIRDWIESGAALEVVASSIQTFWQGQAAYDPADGCSVASTLEQLRRTNGNPYAFLTSYGNGPAEQELSIVDPNDIFDTGGFTFYGTVTAYYSKITLEGETVRFFDTPGATFLGNQLGSHTYVGSIREVLGDEHTLFDQLVIDGAVVASTRESELTSYDDVTGVYSGSLSAFQLAKPDGFNDLGDEYTLTYQVQITTGFVTTTEDRTITYVGTGVADEVITVPIIPIFGSTVALVGECVTFSTLHFYEEDYQRLDATLYTKGPVPAWSKWEEPGWFGCGTPSTISGDDYQDVAVPASGQNIIFGPQDTGDCWSGDGWYGGIAAIISDQDYEAETAGSTGPVEIRGVGWGDYGWYGGEAQPLSSNDYEDETAGAATEESTGNGWGGFGWFSGEVQPLSGNDYEAETAGAATTETTGSGWGGDGWFG